MGEEARQPAGRGRAGWHQLCSAQGVAVVGIQKYPQGGVTGQALASTPGTARGQQRPRGDSVPRTGEGAAAHRRWVVTAAGQRPQLSPRAPGDAEPLRGRAVTPPRRRFGGGVSGEAEARDGKDVFPANLIESEEI